MFTKDGGKGTPALTEKVERAQIESVENLISGRKAGIMGIFLTYKRSQIYEILLVKLGSDVLSPRFFDLYIHRFGVCECKDKEKQNDCKINRTDI